MDSRQSAMEFVDQYHETEYSFVDEEVFELALLTDAYVEGSEKVYLEAQEHLFGDQMD